MKAASFTIYRLLTTGITFKEYCDEIVDRYNEGRVTGNKFESKNNSQNFSANHINNYRLYTRENSTKPEWQFVIGELVSDLGELKNVNHSFVLFLEVEKEVFCITGGTGYLVIEGFKDHYFGLDLLSRIIEPNENIIKETKDRFFSGNRISGQNQFSRFVNINSESGFSNFFRELNVFLPKERIEEIFNLKIDGGKKEYKFLAKDSINLGKSMSLSELDDFLKKVKDLNDKTPLFVLNPFYEVNRQDPVLEKLDKALEKELKELIIHGTCSTNLNVVLPILSRESYFLRKKGSKKDMPYDSSLTDIKMYFYEFFDQEILFREEGFKEVFLDASQIVDENEELVERSLLNLLDFQVIIENKTYWLMEGNWYCLDRSFIEEIDNKFKEKVVTKIVESTDLPELNKWEEGSEGDYNFSHNNIENIYVLDKILVNNIELCDLLVINNEKVYLVHVKDGLDGDVRVLSHQILHSMRILNDAISHDSTIFDSYYESIRNKIGGVSKETGEETTISQGARKFSNVFHSQPELSGLTKLIKETNQEIVFVFAFRPPGSYRIDDPKTIRSTAAKLAMISLMDDVRQFDFNLEFMVL
ncbi:DUF6119 family protein [Saccharococcus sp. Marseille-Q5394]|uniref:DUF6119 family protein n=1 Tax=Saccharococcus sp. Marseille-Q5394 TaxID=2972778 RepID=UPI0021C8CC76|nr:DUF6119 family protein [Saccharococcus sp. Marseille-Q5394]